MHGPTGNITVLSTYGRKYGENKWSKLHSYFFWKQFKHMILNFFCPVYMYNMQKKKNTFNSANVGRSQARVKKEEGYAFCTILIES